MLNNISYLFVPANNTKFITKAVNSNADVVILDLEDSVATQDKSRARLTIKENIDQSILKKKKVSIRINDMSTGFWEEDLNFAINLGVDSIMLPKAETQQQIQELASRITKSQSITIIPLIETAKGLQNAYDIACSSSKISRLAFGSVDFKLDIGASVSDDAHVLLYARSKLITISKAAGIDSPVDSPYTDIQNLEGFETEVKMSKSLGFKSKLLIHPNQISVLHNVHFPTTEELDDAKNIILNFENALKSGIASISYKGQMVDYPVYKQAENTILLANNLDLNQ